jgi:hypothetical protein
MDTKAPPSPTEIWENDPFGWGSKPMEKAVQPTGGSGRVVCPDDTAALTFWPGLAIGIIVGGAVTALIFYAAISMPR